MNVNITLDEEDLGKLMRGEAVNLNLTPASIAYPPVNVNILLQGVAFSQMYQQLRAAMTVEAEAAKAAGIQAAEEGRGDELLQDRLIHVDEEEPLVLRMTPEGLGTLAKFLTDIVEKMPEGRFDDVGGRAHMALYAFQLGHDYGVRFGTIQ